ncbi:MAG TPA: hypothetical protein VEC57_06315 [Candidatus Limnocylindrales bacterium]|nr:hypothetical protein [Candidatus Limnocylindrales bacterium]
MQHHRPCCSSVFALATGLVAILVLSSSVSAQVGCTTAAAPACSSTDCPDGFRCVSGAGVGCACIPDALSCVAAGAPVCDGECPPGQVCQDAGGACGCVTPATGCSAATAPTCAPDDCPSGFRCEDIGGAACGCVPDVVGCTLAAAPMCNGECPAGLVCNDIGGVCACASIPTGCATASAPQCAADDCPLGTTCTDLGIGACACVVDLPTGCLQAAAPACAVDDCPQGTSCTAVGDLCTCLVDEPLSCGLAEAPACSADCPTGTVCTELLGLGVCACVPDEGESPDCTTLPRNDCKQVDRPRHTRLRVIDDGVDAFDSLEWEWFDGAPTTQIEFGDPISAVTNYTVCVYDTIMDTPQLSMTMKAPGGGRCRYGPCWTQRRASMRYKDSARTPDGIFRLRLRPEESGRTSIALGASRGNLSMPDENGMPWPFAQENAVIVQLINDAGDCWGSQYSGPSQLSTPWIFRDKGD